MSEVQVERWMAASPETVFSFFTDSGRWSLWQGVEAVVDARPGGVLRVVMPDRAVAAGRFLEVTPPRRIVFTWGWEGDSAPIPAGSSTVTVELVRVDAGTLVRLTHAGLQTPPLRDLHRGGWERCFDRLHQQVSAGDHGPDRLEARTERGG